MQVMEGRAAGVAVLHELEHGRGAGALQLAQHQPALQHTTHHARVRLDAAHEVRAL